MKAAVLIALSLSAFVESLLVDVPQEVALVPPRDPRFFGHFCMPRPQEFCAEVEGELFGFIPVSREVCSTVKDGRLRLRYEETEAGGRIGARGRVRVDDLTLPVLARAGVSATGRAWARVNLPDFGAQSAWARLVDDGMEMRVDAYGRTLVLRKDACGNAPPQVAIESAGGDALAWGERHCFTGRVTQDEDDSFPASRKRLASDRDGELHPFVLLPTLFPSDGLELTRCTSGLSPGPHTISFTAVDSGGLAGSASLDVTVTNRPPRQAIIVQPRPDDTLVAGGDVVFEGKAVDPEEGLLDGAGVVWSASRAGAPFQTLGTGRRLRAAFPEPGAFTLRMTARDALGAERSVERALEVQPARGNTPPRVTIEVPRHLDVPGPLGGHFPPGELVFRGTVDDSEDAASDLRLRWEAEPVQPAGDPLPPVLGSTLAVFDLPAAGPNRQLWRITFRATDAGGLEGRKVIQVVVMP